jgi:hypothetical protein
MRKVVIASPVATQSGYGHHAREIIKQFIDKKDKEWKLIYYLCHGEILHLHIQYHQIGNVE